MLVKKGLQYQVMKVDEEMARGGIEMQCVEVFGGKDSSWKGGNVYIPPEGSGRVVMGRLDLAPDSVDERRVVGGDFNAHHHLWDNRSREDSRGEKVVEWLERRGLMVLNEGDTTRVERGTVESPHQTSHCVQRDGSGNGSGRC